MLDSLIIHCMLSSARPVSNWFPQLITYSAIRDGILISNIADLRAFLHTDIYTSNFRPVYFLFSHFVCYAPSVLWHCWLGGRKGIRPVKNWVVRCWHGYLSGAHAQLMPLPLTISCSSKIQIGFTFLVPAHLGSAGQSAVKRVCVFVCFWSGPDLPNVLRFVVRLS